MRFRRLELVRYGGFADRVLDFGDGAVDLHLVIGPNEAGKSTMLAAIGDLLFGIPAQSVQNWRYDYGDLRIRALIASATGDIDVTRRKGRKNTLLAPDGSTLADDILAPLLGGMDRRAFERMFGLDHAKLREGGEAILEGKDDAARIVLEAGTGFAGIGPELKKLDEMAGALFKPSAQIPLVNRLMRERSEALALVRTETLADTEWAAIKARREAADTARAALVAEGRALAHRGHAIERINRIRPLLARRVSEQEALDRIGTVPAMPGDAPERLSAALAERRTAQELHDLEMSKRDRAREAAALIVLPDVLLAAKLAIETLFARLVAVERSRQELVERRAERATMEERAARVRADAGLDLDQPIPGAGQRKRLRAMLEEGRGLEREHAGQHHTRQAIEEESAKLPPAQPDGVAESGLDTLRAAVDAIASDATGRSATLAAMQDRLATRLDNAMAGLSPWSGTVAALRTAVPPGAAETLATAYAMELAQSTCRTAEAEIVDGERQLLGLRSDLASLTAAGTLPTPALVAAARAARDGLVHEVRTRLSAARQADDAMIGTALHDAIEQADRLADGRDADAQRIAQHGVLVRREADLLVRIEAAGHVVTTETARLHALRAEWRDLLAHLGFARAMPPADLDRWRGERSQALAIADELAEAVQASADFRSMLEAGRGALDATLHGLGVGADPLTSLDDRLVLARQHMVRLDAAVRAQDLAAAHRKRIDEAHRALIRGDRDLEGRQAVYAADRQQLLRDHRLSAQWSTEAIADALDAFDELALDTAALAAMARQIALDEQHVREFADAVDALLETVGERGGERRFERLRALHDAVLDAVQAQARLHGLHTAERDAIEALTAVERRLSQAEAGIAGLMATAGAASEPELTVVLESVRQVHGHEQELQRLAIELETQCEGIDPAIVAQEAEALSPDEAAAELEAIRIRRQEIEEARETVGRELAAAETTMAGVATAEAAADAQQDAVAIGAAMADAAERHVEATAAAALLRWVIERHRATAQAPLIARAGALFAEVTGQAFTGLVLDYDEDDTPSIRGVRQDASRVGVEGMSEGTRDQLYLALRLGAIAGRDGSQALPVVCDDLLITADDGRAAHMLRVLAAASKRNQIILFSHHDHIADVATKAIGRDGFRLHRIDRTLAGAPASA